MGAAVAAPMVQGAPGLKASDGFSTQADVVIHARIGAHRREPTDGPAGGSPSHPQTGEVMSSPTITGADCGRTNADAANPRYINNVAGHIVRWRERRW